MSVTGYMTPQTSQQLCEAEAQRWFQLYANISMLTYLRYQPEAECHQFSNNLKKFWPDDEEERRRQSVFILRRIVRVWTTFQGKTHPWVLSDTSVWIKAVGGSEPRCLQVKNRNTITESNITSYSIAGIKTEEQTASYFLTCPRGLTANTPFSVLQKLWVWQKLRVHLRDAPSMNVVTNTSQTVKLSFNIMETPQMFDELLIWLQLWASNPTTRLSWCPSFFLFSVCSGWLQWAFKPVGQI